MTRIVRQWIRKAECDWLIAQNSSRAKEALHDGVCFHCQQCSEKYLKAMLANLGANIPRTHNLDDLLSLLTPTYPSLNSLKRGMIFLTIFAVDTRYPGDDSTKRQAAAALRWADQTRQECRRLLGLKPQRKKSP